MVGQIAKIGLENSRPTSAWILFCMQEEWATAAPFRFLIAAYNLLSLLRPFALNTQSSVSYSCLRSEGFVTGAGFSNRSRKKCLLMAAIFQKFDALEPPFAFSAAYSGFMAA